MGTTPPTPSASSPRPRPRPAPPPPPDLRPRPSRPGVPPRPARHRARPPAAHKLPDPTPPRFYRRSWFWFVAAAAVVTAVVVVLVVNVANDATPRPHSVVYRVTGDAPATIDLDTTDASGRVHAQVVVQRLPWTRTATVFGDSATITMTAAVTDLAGQGQISCTITVDGKLQDTDTQRTVAACDASNYGRS